MVGDLRPSTAVKLLFESLYGGVGSLRMVNMSQTGCSERQGVQVDRAQVDRGTWRAGRGARAPALPGTSRAATG